ncbi:CdiA C-terminal domain-containing protein [Streptomyces sp. 8N616]|uniref:CdiA C-terminal domain-containing protein n=1 Tax=Streptomyces sp. 8N616 TaxID=3457414 RepID=UPI003FD03738
MAFIMVTAAVYGVLQLAVLAWPARSVRLSTVLLTIVLGVYGSGVATVLVEWGYTRGMAAWSGDPLADVVQASSYTVAPVVEELAKIVPLLLVGWNLKIRYQLGLADYVVLGAGLGAGFGLLEVLLQHALDAERATPYPGGGWMLPGGISLVAGYIPDLGQVLSTWLPASLGVVELGHPGGTLSTNLHLAWGAVGALGAGLLLRGRGWAKLAAMAPLAFAIGHHTLTNYTGRPKEDPPGWAQWLAGLGDDLVGAAPLICLLAAMAVDFVQLHRAKAAVPGVLLSDEQAGKTGLTALAGFGSWCIPWTALIAVRFARLRRSLFYAAAARTPPDRLEPLRQAVAAIAARMNASNHADAWNSARIRAQLKTARAARGRARRWLMPIPLLLALPSVVFLGLGSFPSTKGIQEFFSTGSGPTLMVGLGIAGLAWIAWQLYVLLRAWRTTAALPVGETLATIRFRLWTALGSTTTGTLLLTLRLKGTPADEEVLTEQAHLLAALDEFLLYLGFVLLLLALFALIPPGGLALAGGGVVAGAITTEAVVNAAALGAAGIVLMAAGADGGVHSGEGERPTEAKPQEGSPGQGKGAIDESEKAFSPKERKIAESLQAEGKNVKALKESTVEGQRTPDALVDGVPTEFKTLQPGAAPNAIKNTLNTAKKQARDAIIDARGSGLSESGAREGMGKFLRDNPAGRMNSIRIIGDGFHIHWP